MLHSVTALMLQKARDECRQLTREQFDMVVMGKLHALCHRDPLTQKYKAQNSERKRTLTPYHFQGHRVCRDTFVFQHTMSIARIKAIKQHEMENRMCPRCEPRCSLTIQPSCPTLRMLSGTSFSTQRTTPFSFLAGYLATRGMDDLQLLPSSTTKREVWKFYHCTASADSDTKAVGYSLFCTFWRKLTPQVVVTHPTSDLCWICQQNSNVILQAHNRPVEEKSEV